MRSQLVNAVQGILVCQALWTTLACQSEAVQSNVLYNAKNVIKTISEDREAVFLKRSWFVGNEAPLQAEISEVRLSWHPFQHIRPSC